MATGIWAPHTVPPAHHPRRCPQHAPLIEVSTKEVFTNTTPVGAYRGAGRPEANYSMGWLAETAARALGIDRVELGRRNYIRPEDMPYKAPNGANYHSGDFTNLLNEALVLADWDGFDQRKAESRLRGRGISDYLELTGPSGREMGGIPFEANDDVTLITGTLDYGQGHWYAFGQVLASRLGIPFAHIKLPAGRQRPADRRGRNWRLEIDDDERYRGCRGRRQMY
jgi:aerobic carbon-monoxide dehydrogenase large subunit